MCQVILLILFIDASFYFRIWCKSSGDLSLKKMIETPFITEFGYIA